MSRARRLSFAALAALASVPVTLLVTALVLAYDPQRMRYIAFAVALAAAVFGIALRVRALAWTAVAATAVSLAVSEAYFIPRPAGLALLPGNRDRETARWFVQAEGGAGDAEAFRFLEEQIPAEATVALAVVRNTYLYPAWDAGLRRTVVFVPEGGAAPKSPTGSWWGRRGRSTKAPWRRPAGGSNRLTGALAHLRPLRSAHVPKHQDAPQLRAAGDPDEEVPRALQYVRKVSGSAKPSQANEAAFERAVDEVAPRRTASPRRARDGGAAARPRGRGGSRPGSRREALRSRCVTARASPDPFESGDARAVRSATRSTSRREPGREPPRTSRSRGGAAGQSPAETQRRRPRQPRVRTPRLVRLRRLPPTRSPCARTGAPRRSPRRVSPEAWSRCLEPHEPTLAAEDAPAPRWAASRVPSSTVRDGPTTSRRRTSARAPPDEHHGPRKPHPRRVEVRIRHDGERAAWFSANMLFEETEGLRVAGLGLDEPTRCLPVTVRGMKYAPETATTAVAATAVTRVHEPAARSRRPRPRVRRRTRCSASAAGRTRARAPSAASPARRRGRRGPRSASRARGPRRTESGREGQAVRRVHGRAARKPIRPAGAATSRPIAHHVRRHVCLTQVTSSGAARKAIAPTSDDTAAARLLRQRRSATTSAIVSAATATETRNRGVLPVGQLEEICDRPPDRLHPGAHRDPPRTPPVRCPVSATLTANQNQQRFPAAPTAISDHHQHRRGWLASTKSASAGARTPPFPSCRPPAPARGRRARAPCASSPSRSTRGAKAATTRSLRAVGVCDDGEGRERQGTERGRAPTEAKPPRDPGDREAGGYEREQLHERDVPVPAAQDHRHRRLCRAAEASSRSSGAFGHIRRRAAASTTPPAGGGRASCPGGLRYGFQGDDERRTRGSAPPAPRGRRPRGRVMPRAPEPRRRAVPAVTAAHPREGREREARRRAARANASTFEGDEDDLGARRRETASGSRRFERACDERWRRRRARPRGRGAACPRRQASREIQWRSDGRAWSSRTQLLDLVAQLGGILEAKLFAARYISSSSVITTSRARRETSPPPRPCRSARRGDVRGLEREELGDVGDALHDGLRRDPVLLVVGDLEYALA